MIERLNWLKVFKPVSVFPSKKKKNLRYCLFFFLNLEHELLNVLTEL